MKLLCDGQLKWPRFALIDNHKTIKGFDAALPSQFYIDAIIWGRVLKSLSNYYWVDLGDGLPGILVQEKGFKFLKEGDPVLVQVTSPPRPDINGAKGATLTRKCSLINRDWVYNLTLSVDLKVRSQQSSDTAKRELSKQELINSAINILEKPEKVPYIVHKGWPEWRKWLRDGQVRECVIDSAPNEPSKLRILEECILPPTTLRVKPFTDASIEDVWGDLFSNKLSLQDKTSILIEKTAVCHTIDVNLPLGKSINTDCIKLIANHINWRQLGGNILIDLPNTKKQDARNKVQRDFSSLLGRETKVLGWGPSGFLELRRPHRNIDLPTAWEMYL